MVLQLNAPLNLRTKRTLKVIARMDILADVWAISVEGAIGTVGEPVGIIIAFGPVLAEQHFPKSSMKIGVNDVERRLGGDIRAGQALIVKVLVFVPNDLAGRLDEGGRFQARKADRVVPNDEAIAVRTVAI